MAKSIYRTEAGTRSHVSGRRCESIALRSPCCAQAQGIRPCTPVRRMRLTHGSCGKKLRRLCSPAPLQARVRHPWLTRWSHATSPVFHAPARDFEFPLSPAIRARSRCLSSTHLTLTWGVPRMASAAQFWGCHMGELHASERRHKEVAAGRSGAGKAQRRGGNGLFGISCLTPRKLGAALTGVWRRWTPPFEGASAENPRGEAGSRACLGVAGRA